METTVQRTETEEKCIEWCNKMLRGERSAVETYEQAIEKHGTNPRLAELRDIQREHKRSVSDLEACLAEMNAEADQSSGAWGVFAKTVQSAANLFGKESAVEALMKGEEMGLNDYLSALESNELTVEHRKIYEMRLIPRIKGNLITLEALESRID
ncbi:MAG: DUF2383 domain-containing protein [Verrucomicrobiales bacterium]|nr:DUF2383 domain-containing protein [Verrucomicrobiales bacterium]